MKKRLFISALLHAPGVKAHIGRALARASVRNRSRRALGGSTSVLTTVSQYCLQVIHPTNHFSTSLCSRATSRQVVCAVGKVSGNVSSRLSRDTSALICTLVCVCTPA